jgi:hypothetical protein
MQDTWIINFNATRGTNVSALFFYFIFLLSSVNTVFDSRVQN